MINIMSLVPPIPDQLLPDLALQIRNFSPKFSYQDRNELLYGMEATSVHNFPHFSIAFFPNQHSLEMAIRILHQRLLHQRRLRVEYAKPEQLRRLPTHTVCDYALKRKIKQDQIHAFRDKMNQLKLTKSNCLFENDKNSNYKFPKVTKEILNWINNHLFNNEQFYNNVLRLMIHLGLDPPFDIYKTDEDNSLATIPIPTDDDDDESELETILNSNDLSQLSEFEWKRRKRKKLKTGIIGEKAESLKVATKKTTTPTVVIGEIFDKDVHINKNKKKLLINIPSSIEQNCSSNSNIETLDGFGLLNHFEPKQALSPPIRSDNFDICLLTKQDLITDEELSTNKLSELDWLKYPVFKDYSPGTISHRLYVKNIHRHVKLKDLYRLFAKYIDLDDDQQMNNFGIVYMEKGRMRGQAFITYPEESQAQQALELVNGYVFFDDKPIVVSFARTNKALN